ncbi:alpha-amylase family glycosyl hydrolase [Occallatibacter riparius]|uniref:Alpha-amylase family glycosyl hydrolase n=1 Tax=Occallatibacter riparius TaxID=1002689 RepID=A0A9J7BXT8_9BACT|nr:alpha-amylase family glycosyl hydrolase [Occallatibacter riparius]UWZ86069.1 alpha-amylase family glycosyl hydrolase [Occallatibacter riparius]
MAVASLERAGEVSATTAWSTYPTLYEIDTWIWLADLARKYGRAVDLGSVPAAEWDAVAAYAFDAVWLMGVWERSPAGIAIANQNEGLLKDFRRALPDFETSDNVGSPYCIRNYEVDSHLGGRDGLAAARAELAARGMKLILDFVPNHVAPDHPWVESHLEHFVRGTTQDALDDPQSFLVANGKVFARGRDPNFPAWPDVLQLNAFHEGLRAAVIETLHSISDQADGVRCDMAMLPMTRIFQKTWGGRAGFLPSTEYWCEVISAVKARSPGFLFIGEAYWDLEWDLQQQGFDFCYDKKLYDRLEHSNAESVRLHLCADLGYQEKLLRFIENHDEPRAAAAFPGAKQRAAAITVGTLPGIRMFHEGEFEGRRVRPPVFLGRRPDEAADEDLRAFYVRLLPAINRELFRSGKWELCERSGWPDNSTYQNVVAWTWTLGDQRALIVVNLSGELSQAHVRVPEIKGGTWSLKDRINGVEYTRAGSEMGSKGLYVELAAWGFHFFECRSK